MAFKDLLLQLTSYPEPTSPAIIDQAVTFAEALGARLTALTFEADLSVPFNPLANALLRIPQMVAAERAKSVANARDLVSLFEAAASRHGVPAGHVIDQCLLSEVPALVTEYSRLRDLTIIPVRVPAGFEQCIAETVIFGAGRPVLVLPETETQSRGIALDVVGVAWDFSGPAARAVADALPILQRAKLVRVVTVTHEKCIDTRRSDADLCRHLACHGVEVVLEEEAAAGRSIGEALTAYSQARNLDLLVMGAYGHSRARDFILGGATKSLIAEPPLPMMLSH